MFAGELAHFAAVGQSRRRENIGPSGAASSQRATWVTCGASRGVGLLRAGGRNGAVQAETCDDCRSYANMLYQAKDLALGPLADDIASLGLAMLVSEARCHRNAPNPFVVGRCQRNNPPLPIGAEGPGEVGTHRNAT